jgi:DNA repair ATPase RecN
MRRNLPDEPEHTCPLIDQVIGWIDGFDSSTDFDRMRIDDLRTFVNHLEENRQEMKEIMEQIRSANDALRQRQGYFEEERDMYEELETCRADLESAEERAAERQAMLEEYERTAPL